MTTFEIRDLGSGTKWRDVWETVQIIDAPRDYRLQLDPQDEVGIPIAVFMLQEHRSTLIYNVREGREDEVIHKAPYATRIVAGVPDDTGEINATDQDQRIKYVRAL